MSATEGPTAAAVARDAPPALWSDGQNLCARTAEGLEAQISVRDLSDRLAGPVRSRARLGLPSGVIYVRPCAQGLVVAHQTPPRVWSLRWLADDSPAPRGRAARYRRIRVGLPYLIVIATLRHAQRDAWTLDPWNEAYFATEPVTDEQDAEALCYPALLNVMACDPRAADRPLAWICTSNLDHQAYRAGIPAARQVRRALQVLIEHLMAGAFNRHGESVGIPSWYTRYAEKQVDARIVPIDAWEGETEHDPLFVLSVPWIRVGRSLCDLAERSVDAYSLDRPAAESTEELVRMVFHHGRRTSVPPAPPTLR